MNYTLHQLKIFTTIVDFKSITKASEALHLTQPAVSIQMKKFQDQFEIPLTEIIGRQLFITDFGRHVYDIAHKILQESDKLKSTTSEFKGLLSGQLHFSIVSTAKYALPYFLSRFVKEHPNVDISIDVTNKGTVLNNLSNNLIDFAMISILPDQMKLKSIELMQNRLVLVGAKDEVKKLDAADNDDLSSKTFIFREQGSATRMAMETFLKKRDLQTVRKIELVSNEAVKQAVLAGLGFSVMPLIGLKNELQNGSLQIVETLGLPINTQWHLAYLDGKVLSPAAQAFVDYLLGVKDSIINKQFKRAL